MDYILIVLLVILVFLILSVYAIFAKTSFASWLNLQIFGRPILDLRAAVDFNPQSLAVVTEL